jgi:hypothetical protein
MIDNQLHAAPTSHQGRLIPVTKWGEYHPWPPIGGLRHLIFHAETNGFASCIVRVGRRILIDEGKFFAWARGSEPESPHVPQRRRFRPY